jgi:hypothetical protein
MRETTSSEFLGWQEYLRAEESETKQEHYYLAQIAAEVRRGIEKKPKSVKLEQFLLKFERRKIESRPLTEEEKQKRAEKSKSTWLAYVNASYNDKAKKRRVNGNSNRT